MSFRAFIGVMALFSALKSAKFTHLSIKLAPEKSDQSAHLEAGHFVEGAERLSRGIMGAVRSAAHWWSREIGNGPMVVWSEAMLNLTKY